MDPALDLAFALRIVAMGLFLTAAAVLARAWRQSSLQAALAFGVLRRDRRQALVTALLVLFTSLGLAVGLSAYQDVHYVAFDLAQVVGGTLLLAAAIATFALTWQGFGVLPTAEQALLVTDAPEPYLAAIGVADREASRRAETVSPR
ncbi:MAG TPA: hypothetical protein VLX64_01770 [Thermoplasmata archaeon]|nr:hypothetical protein [Thermoplasmata archaeon]HUJ77714.1 hypothetical protein [Thermoplasmata archaeon]